MKEVILKDLKYNLPKISIISTFTNWIANRCIWYTSKENEEKAHIYVNTNYSKPYFCRGSSNWNIKYAIVWVLSYG